MQRYITTSHTIGDVMRAMDKSNKSEDKKDDPNPCTYIFNNIVQRGLVWNPALKSDLIGTVMEGGSIPPIYVNYIGNNTFDVFDGKQRLNALYEFYTDKLRICKTDPFTLESGEVVDLNGKKYSQLTDEQKGIFLRYSLTRITAENLSQEEMNKQFRRLNAGKPLTSTEKSRAYIKSLPEFSKLSNHVFFEKYIDEKNKAKSKNLTYVKNIYAVLFFEEKSLLESKLKVELAAREMSQDEYDTVEKTLDYMYGIMCTLEKNKCIEGKKAFAILKNRITHFVLVAWLANQVRENTSPEDFCDWLMYFFYPSNLKKSTVSDEYNELSLTGTSSPKNVARKLEIISENFTNFPSAKKRKKVVKQISFDTQL